MGWFVGKNKRDANDEQMITNNEVEDCSQIGDEENNDTAATNDDFSSTESDSLERRETGPCPLEESVSAESDPSIEENHSLSPFVPSTPSDEMAKEENVDIPMQGKVASIVSGCCKGEQIEERLDEQKLLLEKVLSEFSMKLKYDEKKQEQIDQLYRENLVFREGLVEKFKMKLIQGVIELIDDTEKQISYFNNVEYSEINFKKLLNSMQDIALSFRDMLLERFDIQSWQSESDSAFDPSCQRTLRTTPTADPSKIKTLCHSIRYGYKNSDGQLIRPELVNVYVLDKNAVVTEELKKETVSTKTQPDNEEVLTESLSDYSENNE